MSAVAKFFIQNKDDNTVVFMGDKALCRIPQRYADKNLLIIDTVLSALGLFDIEVIDKGKSHIGGINLPAMIHMEPADTYQENIDGVAYTTAVLTKGSKFMTTTTIVQEEAMGYIYYLEGIYLGNFPKFITEDNIYTLFDDFKEVVGRGIPTNHATLELIYAQRYKDPDDLTKPYRLSSMTKPAVGLPFRDVAHHTNSTHARIVGGYADDGRNAAMLNPNTDSSQLEDYFRS